MKSIGLISNLSIDEHPVIVPDAKALLFAFYTPYSLMESHKDIVREYNAFFANDNNKFNFHIIDMVVQETICLIEEMVRQKYTVSAKIDGFVSKCNKKSENLTENIRCAASREICNLMVSLSYIRNVTKVSLINDFMNWNDKKYLSFAELYLSSKSSCSSLNVKEYCMHNKYVLLTDDGFISF